MVCGMAQASSPVIWLVCHYRYSLEEKSLSGVNVPCSCVSHGEAGTPLNWLEAVYMKVTTVTLFSPCAGIQNYNIISLTERYAASLSDPPRCLLLYSRSKFFLSLFVPLRAVSKLFLSLFCHRTVIQHYFCCWSPPAPSCYFVELFSRLIATLRVVLSALLRFKINFYRMVENCFVEV